MEETENQHLRTCLAKSFAKNYFTQTVLKYEVHISDLCTTEVSYYQLDTQNNSAVRKMVVID